MKILGNLHFHSYLCVKEAVTNEKVDLKGQDLVYQSMRAELALVIDNSEMGEWRKHCSVSSLFFQDFFFF